MQLLVDLPSEVTRTICDLGVETCIDFRGLWKSAEECVSEVETLLGASLTPDVAFQLARSWTLARREVEDQTQRIVTSVVQFRHSSLGTRRPEPSQAPSVKPAPSSNRIRPLVVGGGGVSGPMILTERRAEDPFAKEDASRQLKIDALFQLAVDNILDLEEMGVAPSDLRDPLRWRELRDTTMSAASTLSVHRLGMLVSSYKRWLRFCSEHNADHRNPSPLLLASFLKQITAGGPTASASMHAALTWFMSSLGANIPVAHWLVKPFKFHAAAHSGRQAPELEPWELANLLMILKEAKGTHQIILALVVMAAVGCVRWEHIQRTKYVQNHTALQTSLLLGFTRGDVPWLQLVEDPLCGFWEHEAVTGSQYLVPALKLHSDDLWEVTESTAFWGTRRCPVGATSNFSVAPW